MKKHLWKLIFVMLISVYITTSCDKKDVTTAIEKGEPATPAEETVTEEVAAVEEKAQDEKGAEATDDTDEKTDVNYDKNFELFIEAEDADFTGDTKVESTKQGFSGTGYLNALTSDHDTITFIVSVPGAGAYDLNFISAGNTGHKENNVIVDGINVGTAIVEENDFMDSRMERVYLTAGEHKIQLTKSWGWILLDALQVTASPEADETIYEVSAVLVDPEATDRTRRLMQYLTDVYGEYIISGQYGDRGIDGPEFKAINQASGKYPAMLGLDMIEYSPSRVANGSAGMDVQYAKKFDKEGGIVTFAWHWNAPEKYLIDTKDNPWWKGFYTDGTIIDLAAIMNGEDQEGYDLLIRDIDTIAFQLKKLQEADIPILWRPLHEASGGWFWWGAAGPEAYIKLYQLLFDRLMNYHDLHNLIWVWNGQNRSWYPGDQYVDIVGTDIYPGERVYSSQVSSFNNLVDWTDDTRKLVAMTENGCIFDPELAARDNAMWSYFGTWEGEFLTLNNTYTLSERYTETDMLVKVYTNDLVITLDELPDLRTYGN